MEVTYLTDSDSVSDPAAHDRTLQSIIGWAVHFCGGYTVILVRVSVYLLRSHISCAYYSIQVQSAFV